MATHRDKTYLNTDPAAWAWCLGASRGPARKPGQVRTHPSEWWLPAPRVERRRRQPETTAGAWDDPEDPEPDLERPARRRARE